MPTIMKNWKTSLTGVVIIGIAAMHAFLGLSIPGAMDLGPALTVGLGLILAHDGVQ